MSRYIPNRVVSRDGGVTQLTLLKARAERLDQRVQRVAAVAGQNAPSLDGKIYFAVGHNKAWSVYSRAGRGDISRIASDLPLAAAEMFLLAKGAVRG